MALKKYREAAQTASVIARELQNEGQLRKCSKPSVFNLICTLSSIYTAKNIINESRNWSKETDELEKIDKIGPVIRF